MVPLGLGVVAMVCWCPLRFALVTTRRDLSGTVSFSWWASANAASFFLCASFSRLEGSSGRGVLVK